MKFFKYSVCLPLLILAGFSCNKVDTYPSEELSEYMNLQVGNYIRYNLDSLKFVFFGQKDTIISYQAKDVVDVSVTDNLGRASWRMIRYLRDSASTNESDWRPSMTYLITPTRETIEVIENNQRFQKLKLPLINGFTWKGNSYIDTYNDFEMRFLDNWDYTYEEVGSTFTDSGRTSVPGTITVSQINAEGNIGNPTAPIVQKVFSKEVYAKNIGLVYKDFIKWEYQASFNVDRCYSVQCLNNKCDTIDCELNPVQCDSVARLQSWTQKCRDSVKTGFYYEGYGIRLKMIDHN